MKPLIVLLSVFAISLVIVGFSRKKFEFALSARMAMSFMLLFTTMGHFMFADGMALMIPDFIPARTFLVYLTGVIEVAAAIGLQVSRLRKLTGWLLIAFFILILPANVYAAMNNLNYQTGALDYSWPHIR